MLTAGKLLKYLSGRSISRGWNVIDLNSTLGVGITLLSAQPGRKPRVVRHTVIRNFLDEGTALAHLGQATAQKGCACLHPLARGDYNILILPEPEVAPVEMTESVRWSVASQIDYPIEEANVAWLPIPTRDLLPNRPPLLYVIAARHARMEQLRTLFMQAGLHLRVIDVRETAQRNISALIEPPDEGLGLLAMDQNGIQFTVTYRGELFLDRYIGKEALDSDEDSHQRSMERIALQVQRSLDFVQRTLPFITLREVRIGPSADQAEMVAYMTNQITATVKPLDLAELFDFDEVPALLDHSAQAEAFVALGSALRTTGTIA